MDGQTVLFLYIVVFIGIVYFFTIRPQMRRQREQAALLAALRPGDAVITAGGLYGTVRAVNEASVELQLAEGVVVEVAKAAVVAKRETA